MSGFSNRSAFRSFPFRYRPSRRCSSNVIQFERESRFERECTRESRIVQIGVTSRSTPPVPRKKNSNVSRAEPHNFSMFALVCGDASSWTDNEPKEQRNQLHARRIQTWVGLHHTFLYVSCGFLLCGDVSKINREMKQKIHPTSASQEEFKREQGWTKYVSCSLRKQYSNLWGFIAFISTW